jgi:hypothetical protein
VEPLRHTAELGANLASVTAVPTALPAQSPRQQPSPHLLLRLLPRHPPQRLPARPPPTVHVVAQLASPALGRLLATVVHSTDGVVAPPIIALLDVTHLSVLAQALLLLRLPRLPPPLPHLPRRLQLMDPVLAKTALPALDLLSVRAAPNTATVVPPPVTAELDATRASESAPKQCPPSL